jgi:outer membrane beta-barrel protein
MSTALMILLLSAAGAEAPQQQLVSGAPLENPNVAVHIVERKEYADKWARELTLYPGVAQVNGKFTNHLGLATAFTWHLHENFALMVMGMWNYLARESDFNAELIDKVRAEPPPATSLLLVGGALGGVEVTPFYGKFVFYDSYLVHFAVVLSAGAGAGMTRHQLKPANAAGPATFGETGWRFLAEIGGGFRVQFARWITLRLEIRDIVYTARVDAVNGCNRTDLHALDDALRTGRPLSSAVVAPACNVSRFEGVDEQGDDDPSNDRQRSDDVPLAFALVKVPSSDVLNNLGVYLGVSLTF